MPHPAEPARTATSELLRDWGLPDPGESKKSRGDVVVVGGSLRTPGAVILSLEAALRVGAGRVAAVVPGTIDAHLGAAVPEAAIHTLPERAGDPFGETVALSIQGAGAVLVGPGFDDADETRLTIRDVATHCPEALLLDAYGLGVLPDVDRDTLPDVLILTPNREELALLLDRDLGDDPVADVRAVAQRYRATVTCYGVVADPDGSAWRIDEGGPGLGTAGSGDVLAGAVAGLTARGLDAARAAVWGTWVHARAGDRLTQRAGLTFLARDLVAELGAAQREVTDPDDGGTTTADLTVADWLRALSRSSGEVGGGAGCALLTAMSASLLAMVAGYDETAGGAVRRAGEVRAAALRAADRDEGRSAALGRSLRGGVDVAGMSVAAARASLEIGELATELVAPWRDVAATAKAYLRADVVLGVATLEAALRGVVATAGEDLALATRHGAPADAGAAAALARLGAAREDVGLLARGE